MMKSEKTKELLSWLNYRDQEASLKTNCESRVIWAGKQGTSASVCILCIHGFGASPGELDPVPEQVAKHFGANLVIPRLSGHGVVESELEDVLCSQWKNDVLKAYELASLLGEQVWIIGSSTGATLSAWLHLTGQLRRRCPAIVWLSPNFGMAHPFGFLLSKKWFIQLLNKLSIRFVRNRQGNLLQQQYWSSRYPIPALGQVQRLVEQVWQLPDTESGPDVMCLYNQADDRVSVQKMLKWMAKWQGAITFYKVHTPEEHSRHVLAGDACNPQNNQQVFARIVKFFEANRN